MHQAQEETACIGFEIYSDHAETCIDVRRGLKANSLSEERVQVIGEYTECEQCCRDCQERDKADRDVWKRRWRRRYNPLRSQANLPL